MERDRAESDYKVAQICKQEDPWMRTFQAIDNTQRSECEEREVSQSLRPPLLAIPVPAFRPRSKTLH